MSVGGGGGVWPGNAIATQNSTGSTHQLFVVKSFEFNQVPEDQGTEWMLKISNGSISITRPSYQAETVALFHCSIT